MPLTIVFDTNYLRGLSSQPYLLGDLPDTLSGQIDKAVTRGDLIAMVPTVRMEMNAWLQKLLENRKLEVERAAKTLQDAGYTLVSPEAKDQGLPDIYDAFVRHTKMCALLPPTLEDYVEAERRTSFRLPPHPKKPDDEELRDRLIWCQLVRYSSGGRRPVLAACRAFQS